MAMSDVPDSMFRRLAHALTDRYRLEREIGAGGMATVYVAQDLKHERRVAIKVLRPELSASVGSDRFLREIHVAAQLQHPHILTLIDSGSADGLLYYVMPYVEGDSLRTTLARGGALPVTETVQVLRDVADALAYAHAHGVVHRDVKPENVMFSGRHALVMDFGIAKAISEATGPGSLTSAGMAVGTPAYMAPEQVAADPAVDHRADLYALGVLGYEMLAGRTPFAGASPQATLAAHVTQTPEPVTRHRPTIPPALGALIMRCLAKRPQDRCQNAGEVLQALEGMAIPSQRATTPAGSWAGHRAWVFVAVVALVVAVAVAGTVGMRRALQPVRRPPQLVQATFRQGVQQDPSWSPDGKQIAFTGDAGAVRKIFLKPIDAGQETQLTNGPYDDLQPAWSPDGRTLLFVRAQKPSVRLEPGDLFGEYSGGDIWAADLGTGKTVKLIENGFNPAYSADGVHIAFDASWGGPRRIWMVDAQGHNPEQISADSSEAVNHLRPRWSPDGTNIVFQNMERTNFHIRVVNLRSRKTEWVTTGLFQDLSPAWAPNGRSIYFSSARSGGLNLWRVPVASDGTPSGLPEPVTNGGGQDADPAMARDGKLAFAILRQNADIWRLPVSPESGVPTGPPQALIATTREDSRGAWSPDVTRIAFNSDRNGQMNIWLYSLADGWTRQLTHGPGGDFQPNWSPDGRRIAFFSSRASSVDIWTVDVESGTLVQLTRSASIEVNPFFSPDGKRIAYQSDQSGRLEVWVMNADGSGAGQLTRSGAAGHFLRWTAEGRAVLFRCPCGGKPQIFRVPINGGAPEPEPDMAGGAHMSFSPDHSRIMDAVGHKTLWVSPFGGGKPAQVFAFDDAEVRIDYPVWSPDGKWVLFDHFRPEGADIWVLQGVD